LPQVVGGRIRERRRRKNQFPPTTFGGDSTVKPVIYKGYFIF
jgi:hypothetical protein